MRPTPQLSLGAPLDIPPRLSAAIAAHSPDAPPAGADLAAARQLLAAAEGAAGAEHAARAALGAFHSFAQAGEGERALQCLGLFAIRCAQLRPPEGPPLDPLGLLIDAADLSHAALALCHPRHTPAIARLLERLAHTALERCAQQDGAALTAATADVSHLLQLVAVLWWPDLEAEIRTLDQSLPALAALGAGELCPAQRPELERLAWTLMGMQISLAHRPAPEPALRERQRALLPFVGACLQVAQAALLRPAAPDERRPAAAPPEPLADQAERRIADVERRLRELIAAAYGRRFGPDWVRQIEQRHAAMYDIWMRNLQRDQEAFRAYRQYSPAILEYARFDDLRALICSQWGLFERIFDFGHGERNRTIFIEKMSQIAHVRNPLAHHRSIPENELLRAIVLCTDVLIAADQPRGQADAR